MDIRIIRRRCLFPLIAHSIGLWACVESFFMNVSCRPIYWCAKFSRINPSMCLYVRVFFCVSLYIINTVLFITLVWVYLYSTCVCIYINTCETLCMYVCIFSACTYAQICIYLYQFTNIYIRIISFLLVPIRILFFFHVILSGEPSMQHHTYVNISREICISIYIHIGYEYVLLCVMYVYLFFNLFFALFFNSCPKFAVPASDKHFSIVFPGKYAISSWCYPASPSTRFLSLQSCHQLDCPGLYGTTTGTPGHLFWWEWLSCPPIVASFSITHKGAGPPDSGHMGVIGALVYFFFHLRPSRTNFTLPHQPGSALKHWNVVKYSDAVRRIKLDWRKGFSILRTLFRIRILRIFFETSCRTKLRVVRWAVCRSNRQPRTTTLATPYRAHNTSSESNNDQHELIVPLLTTNAPQPKLAAILTL